MTKDTKLPPEFEGHEPLSNGEMRPTPELRYVEMGPGAFVLEQGWLPVLGNAKRVTWRPVPTVSRKDAGYG